MTRALGGSAACTREAEPPQEHDLAEPSHEEKSRGKEREMRKSRFSGNPLDKERPVNHTADGGHNYHQNQEGEGFLIADNLPNHEQIGQR